MIKQALVLLILAGGMCLAQQSNMVSTPQPSGWISLFNGKDFSGWHKFLEMRSKKDTGLVDHNLDSIFQIVDGSIYMYKDSPQDAYVPEGFLMTEKEYGDYRLRLEFKWGAKKFAQRAGRKRNSGLMFHAQDTRGFWPTSIECQVMEGGVGDIYTQNHAWCTTTIDTIVVDSLSNRAIARYAPSGRTFEHGGAGSRRVMHESRLDNSEGWNTIEISVKGSEATFFVNSKPSSRMWNIRHINPQNPNEVKPLTKGRILLQAEATEILYRNIMIKEIE